ncbi:MAG: AraC family transcriptional regulator [Cyclobacteriaceae bacterium]
MMIRSKKKIEDNVLMKVSKMKPIIKPTKPHKHSGYHELIFLSAGSGSHIIDNDSFEIHPQMGFNLKEGQVHCWDFSQIPEGYVILFKEQLVADNPVLNNNLYNIPDKFELPEDSGLFLILEEFYREYKAGKSIDIMCAYLNLIVLKALSTASSPGQASSSTASEFYQFKTLLNENFIKLRSPADYAALMNLSVHRLNSICKSTCNMTVADLIKQRLLVEAKNLITHTGLNISEIAYSLNFSDSSNFTKFFRSLTRLTPVEYRSRLV